jgi:hypothetical protein
MDKCNWSVIVHHKINNRRSTSFTTDIFDKTILFMYTDYSRDTTSQTLVRCVYLLLCLLTGLLAFFVFLNFSLRYFMFIHFANISVFCSVSLKYLLLPYPNNFSSQIYHLKDWITLKSHTRLNKFCIGISLHNEDCGRGSSYIWIITVYW